MVRSTRDTSVWTYLLLGAFGFAAAVMVLLIAAAFLIPFAIDRTIEKYTDSAPQAGEDVDIPDQEYERLIEKVEIFADALDAGYTADPLVLTSDEVAALIRREVQAELNNGSDGPSARLWLRIEGHQLKGPVSISTDELAVGWLAGLQGRYLNGVASMDVWHADSQIWVRLADFQIDGETIPGWALDGLQDAIDIAMADSRELRDLGRKLGGLELYDGKATIRLKDRAR